MNAEQHRLEAVNLLNDPRYEGMEQTRCHDLLLSMRTAHWLHVKTKGVYRVYAVAQDESTLELKVMYRHVNMKATWIRSAKDFLDGRFVKLVNKRSIADDYELRSKHDLI